MFERRYSDGDPIYLAGDASDAVFRIRSGKVRSVGGPGRMLGAGDFLGGLQLLSGGPRAESAHAVGEVIVDAMTRAEFLRVLETDAAAVQVALSALFDHMAVAAAAVRANGADVSGPRVAVPQVRLFGANKHVQDQIGLDGIAVGELPFRVGRRSPNGSAQEESVHLQLADPRPYFMSRRHFAIERDRNGLVVRDCGSHSGTVVNGTPIGVKAERDVAPLAPGRNEIVAGKAESPFRFLAIVESPVPTRS
jgi:hypothetical protein